MKVNPKFRLRNPHAPNTSIFLDVRWKRKRLVYGTGKTIATHLWDKESMRTTKKRKTLSDYKKADPEGWAELNDIDIRLNEIEKEVHSFFRRAGNDEVIRQELKDHLVLKFAPGRVAINDSTLNGFISQFITEIVSGKRQTPKGTKYSPNTIKQYKSFQLRFTEFQAKKHRVFDFEDINLDFYDLFTSYLTKIGNKPNSAGKQIKCLKAILRAALELKLHDNRSFQSSKFRVNRIETDQIYLTESELNDLAVLDLSSKKHLDVARDLFLIGCYTAQRYGDYCRINKKSITTIDGKKCLDLKQEKTGKRVIIPINGILMSILKKYDYSAPYMAVQKLNKNIKVVGRLAGINGDKQISYYEKGLRCFKYVPKYELIKSHTARRTGATLLHKANAPLFDLMKITGHKNPKELLNYIRISEEETAIKMFDNEFFSPLKVASRGERKK